MIWPPKPQSPEREAADAMAALQRVKFTPWGKPQSPPAEERTGVAFNRTTGV